MLAQRRDERMHGRESLEPLANHRLRHAIEVRHESFVDPAFISLLRKLRIAWVVAGPGPSRDGYCYFDNTDKLHAPNNAAELMFKLGLRGSPVIGIIGA